MKAFESLSAVSVVFLDYNPQNSMSSYVVVQWSPTLGLQMFLGFNSQKSWPAEVGVKASGSCSARTSGGPSLGTTVVVNKQSELEPTISMTDKQFEAAILIHWN